MRASLLLSFGLLVAGHLLVAQDEPRVTPEMQAMEAKLLARVGPQTKAWIKQEAARQKAVNAAPGALDSRSLATYSGGSNLSDGDIMALSFLVMMESAKSAQEDLKSVMAGVKAINANKASTRESISEAKPRPAEKPDSIYSISDVTALRLQTTMDRRSKTISMLSNIMKKISETEATISQNLK